MLNIPLVFILTAFLTCSAEKFRFDNYTLYKIIPKGVDQITLLQNLHNTDQRYDFWSEPTPYKEYVNILSSPEYKRDLEGLLSGNGITFEISMQNIQEAIDKEITKSYTRGDPRSMTWNNYYTNDQINDWLDDLATAYPDVVTPLTIGTSFEGRPIKGIKISHGGANNKVIFIEGGIHAREWISPATVCFVTNELLTSTDEAIVNATVEYDWYIFPVTNPDGYVWTHESFRMWRKNRQPYGDHFGVDLNRNWNNNWMVVGASLNPATDIFAGPGPFSEPETLHLSRFISSIGNQIEIYLTFHSFGQMLLIPFGNTTEHLANYDEALSVGKLTIEALSARHGTQYVTGNSAEVIYEASGAADDWVKERINPPLVYCYELRDTGTHGFLLPPDQIQATGEETMDSVIEMIKQGKLLGVLSVPEENNGENGGDNDGENGGVGLRVSAFIVIFAVIDQATGDSVNWDKEQLKVPLVYCYELRDRGQFGFLLPADQIYPSRLETMDSVLEIIHQGKRFGIIAVNNNEVK